MNKVILFLVTMLLAFSVIAGAQPPAAQAPIASNPVVEMKGKVTSVQIARGQGMPSLEMEGTGGTTKVLLGSLRYLMQQNFSPKAGDEIAVKGYKTAGEIVAISVTLLDENKTLRLRDERGWPLWMGGRGRRGRGGGMRGCCAAQRAEKAP